MKIWKIKNKKKNRKKNKNKNKNKKKIREKNSNLLINIDKSISQMLNSRNEIKIYTI